ncbi:bifunctional (p)ppGpp synthetase/guanosine-3',5'-bis(diphosphate) 3'-pyrophosphohydrolase [Patescibacteria group bacterium]|nr:bifunctional (p)ppGpp synthetase/guanosine-3',5'-bis(diphosphate) 3'-pyrophosphohydrolase [Patescibacteria group bacterium]
MSMDTDIRHIYDLMRHDPTQEERDLLERAYQVAEEAHRGQQRASGEPYFNHVFATARNLAEFGLDATTIAAGFLHDTIEDTPVTEEEIQKEFGDEIVFLVNGVTKLGTLKYQGRERHVESLRKFFIATAEDFRVVVIKLADRLHNVQTLKYVKPEKQARIALETIEIYAPLAYRLGMGRLVGQLQDASFPFAYPKESAMVEDLLRQKKKINEKYLEKVWRTLKVELAKHNIKDLETHQRVKGRYSLWKKLERKDMDMEQIYDLVALRIIVPTVDDCYRVLGIIHSKWRPLPGRIKDYIALPKVNGYQSIHTTIFTGDGGIAEIQVRTPEMHEFAEYGFAAHHIYKQRGSTVNDKHSIAWLRELKELQDTQKKDFLKELKTDLFEDRIFVFTPKGDVIDLPREASAIDFAYAIHSEIGNTAQAALINGKNSALKTKLESGDIVEIQTNKKGIPSGKWLPHVKTSMAKKHIEKYLRENSLWNKFFNK